MSASSDRCLQTPSQSDTPKDTRIKPTNREWKTFYFVTFPLLRCGSIFLPPPSQNALFTSSIRLIVAKLWSITQPPLPCATPANAHLRKSNLSCQEARKITRARKIGCDSDDDVLAGPAKWAASSSFYRLSFVSWKSSKDARSGDYWRVDAVGERGWWVLNLAVTGGPSLAGFKRRPLVWASPVFVKIAFGFVFIQILDSIIPKINGHGIDQNLEFMLFFFEVVNIDYRKKLNQHLFCCFWHFDWNNNSWRWLIVEDLFISGFYDLVKPPVYKLIVLRHPTQQIRKSGKAV